MVGSAEAVIRAAVVEGGSRVGPGCVRAVLVLSEWASGRETRAAPQSPSEWKAQKAAPPDRSFVDVALHPIAPSPLLLLQKREPKKKPESKPSSGKLNKRRVRAHPWSTDYRVPSDSDC